MLCYIILCYIKLHYVKLRYVMCCYVSQITRTSKFNGVLWCLIALVLQIWAGSIMSAGLENLKMQVFWNITPCSWEYSSQHPRRLECSTSIHEPQTSHQKTCYMSPESNCYPQIPVTVYKQFKIKAHVFFPCYMLIYNYLFD